MVGGGGGRWVGGGSGPGAFSPFRTFYVSVVACHLDVCLVFGTDPHKCEHGDEQHGRAGPACTPRMKHKGPHMITDHVLLRELRGNHHHAGDCVRGGEGGGGGWERRDGKP